MLRLRLCFSDLRVLYMHIRMPSRPWLCAISPRYIWALYNYLPEYHLHTVYILA